MRFEVSSVCSTASKKGGSTGAVRGQSDRVFGVFLSTVFAMAMLAKDFARVGATLANRCVNICKRFSVPVLPAWV